MKCKLLVAEDELIERKVLCRTLQKYLGDLISLYEAKNGREALEIFAREAPQVAVLDIEMPVNLVFLLMFCFVLVVLLSLSIAISQLADKCKRLTQANEQAAEKTEHRTIDREKVKVKDRSVQR